MPGKIIGMLRKSFLSQIGWRGAHHASVIAEALHAQRTVRQFAIPDGKILSLPDAVEVYPAHGAGSLCGRNISSETSSTVGAQRRGNWALQPMAREEFVRLTTRDLPEVPRYFPHDVALNREGARPLGSQPPPAALDPAQVERHLAAGAVAVDVRPAADFGAGHVPGSLNIGLGGQFASWAGTLVAAGRPVIVVAEDEEGAREAVVRLTRVGLESVLGHLDGGVAAWDRAGLPLVARPQITVDELRSRRREIPTLQVVDVRRKGEYVDGHVPGAVNVPLDRLERDAGRLDPARPTAVICAGGYRSSAATSVLERGGFADLANVVGGTSAWIAAGYEVEKGEADGCADASPSSSRP